MCIRDRKIIELVLLIAFIMQYDRIRCAAKAIANGDFSQPVDTSKLMLFFRKHGEDLNNVSNGIEAAVSEKMKSERFRTELITNVSHDIKTPLTSIINYVDLLQKEDIDNEKVREYLDVLDRQSSRLKKLIQDLLAVDTYNPQKIKGGLANEFSLESAVGIAAMVKADRLQMKMIAEELTDRLKIPVYVGGVEADMAIKGALTTPGTNLSLIHI